MSDKSSRPDDDPTRGFGHWAERRHTPETESDEFEQTRARLMRVSAELENFRKRSRRETEEQEKYGALPFLRDLLPVVDNLRHALEAAESTSDSGDLTRGVHMIFEQLNDVMHRHQCEEIKALDEPFDPEVHEAMRQVSGGGRDAGIVIDVVQPGYRMYDRVIRPARVVVSGP